MTVIIVSAILLTLAVPIFIAANRKDWCTIWVLSLMVLLSSGLALITGMICYIPSHKNSEIKYEQLVQERISIEAMLETDKNVDRITLNELVINYNNSVIRARNNSQRPVYREYYSDNVDWTALETIDWR